MPSPGALLCLASAAAFGAMGIFGKLAYEEGANVGTLLAARFVLAAALFWLVAALTSGASVLRALPRRDIAIGLALGGVGYSAQAGGYFAALERLDASLLSLLIYTFPAIVAVTAIAIGRERASRRTAATLALASTGLVLVLAGAAAGALDPVGTALGLAAAVVYSAYILSSEGIAARIGPLALGTLVCTGAAATLTLGGVVGGELDPGGVSVGGLRLAGRPRGRLDGRRRRPLLRRAAARRPDRRVDPVDARAGRHRRAGGRRLRRVARPHAAGRRRPRPLRGSSRGVSLERPAAGAARQGRRPAGIPLVFQVVEDAAWR